MKAVVCPRYGSPEVLQLTSLPDPTPRADEIRVKIRATSVTVADVRVRAFDVPTAAWLPARLFLGLTKPKMPVLGVELAGTVDMVGSAVTRFRTGDEVMAATLSSFGGYAEYKCLKETAPIALKPKNLTFAEAATIPVGARTAQHFLQRSRIKAGDQVLIYGASGSVGTYAVQLAVHFGAEVTGVCSATNMELVRSLGAKQVLDYRTNFTSELKKYDVILMAVDKWSFSECKNYLKHTGAYVNITNPLPSPQMLWTQWTSQKRVLMADDSPDTADALNELSTLIEKGALKPVIDRTYALEQIVEAHRYVDSGRKRGNVAIVVNEPPEKTV